MHVVDKGGESAVLGLWGRLNTRPWTRDRTHETGSSLLATCAHSRGAGHHAMQDHMGTVSNQRLWEAGLQCQKNEISPGFHWRMWLACLNNSAGWQGTETCNSAGPL